MESPVFYLKANVDTDESMRCFKHWVDIANAFDASIYVICDNEKLKNKIISGFGQVKFLSSYRERSSELLGDMLFDYWHNTGYAHFTTFLHAQDNHYNNFWNIDADDTMMLCDVEYCVKALKKVSDYAEDNEVDLMSLDMWFSRFGGLHWSFGVTYARMQQRNYIDTINGIRKFYLWLARVKHLKLSNIDFLFSYLKFGDYLNCQTFYIKDMYFCHAGKWIDNFQCGKLRKHKNPGRYSYFEYPIREETICFDTGIRPEDCEKFMSRNSIPCLYEQIKEIHKTASLVIFGAGKIGRNAVSALRDIGCETDYFCDNSEKLWGRVIDGISVINPDDLCKLQKNQNVRVFIATIQAHKVKKQLEELGMQVIF